MFHQHLLGHGRSFGTHLPMASLELAFDGDAAAQDYRRSLNLSEGIVFVDYGRNDRRFHREVFSSNPDDVLVVRCTCDQKKSVSFNLSFAPLTLPGDITVEGADTL